MWLEVLKQGFASLSIFFSVLNPSSLKSGYENLANDHHWEIVMIVKK